MGSGSDLNAVLVEISAGIDSNILRFVDKDFIDSAEYVLKAITDDAEKLVGGPATIQCLMKGQKVAVGVDNLCTLLACCRADQGEEGIAMLFMAVEPKEDDLYDTADEPGAAELGAASAEKPGQASVEMAATVPGEGDRPAADAAAAPDIYEGAKMPTADQGGEKAHVEDHAWDTHISAHITQVLANQLYGLDPRKALPQLAVKTVEFLASHDISEYPDSLIQICEGNISHMQQCVSDGVGYSKAAPRHIKEEFISLAQVWIMEIKQEGMAKTSAETHPNIICDLCEMSPIVGKRYASKINPNFDLCENCIQHDNIALYDQIQGQVADVVSFSYSSASSGDHVHVDQSAFCPGARTTVSPPTTTTTTTGATTTTTGTTTTTAGGPPTTTSTAHAAQAPEPEKDEAAKNAPEILACGVSNSLSHPGYLEGPVVDIIKQHGLDGAYLAGQFDGPGVATIRLRNPGKTPINNAALCLCYGQGMGYKGIALGTVAPGEEFEVLMRLEADAKLGMSMWAFTSDGEPIGTVICAQSH